MRWQPLRRFTLFRMMIVVALCAIGLWVAAERIVDHSARQIWTLCHDPRAANREKAINELVGNVRRPGPKTLVPVFIKALDDPSSEVRSTAVIMLSTYGSEAGPSVKALCRHVRDPDFRVSIFSARALESVLRGKCPDREAAETALVAALDDQRFQVRINAARALIRIGKADATVPTLLKLARAPEDGHRWCAVKYLSDAGVDTSEVDAAFVHALNDPSDRVKIEAAIALLSTREAEALRVLKETATDWNIPAHNRARQVLQKYTSKGR